MSTAVAIPALPAHLQQYVAKHADENAGASGGIRAGSWPRISIGGAKFSIKQGGEATLICDPSNPDLPKMQLELVVVGHNSGISKTYYAGKWSEGDSDEPDCSSDDGVFPDAHVAIKQATACATCPQNAWGSKISETGKQIKACSDSKRLVVLQAADLQGDAYELSIKPASLKDWALYVKALDQQRIPVSAVKTLVYFDPSVTYPKLLFKFGGYLTAEELAVVEERKDGEDVMLIASPRRTGANLPPAGTIPINPAPAPQPAPAAAAPAPAPAPAPVAPVVMNPFAGTQPHVKPAVTAAGGLGTPGGDATYKALTGKDAPVAQAAPAPAPTPEPPKPVDPFEGQPAHVEPAVTAAGGLGTPGGDATYTALTKKPPPGVAAVAAQPAKRGRKAAATLPAQPVAAVAPAIPPAAAAAAPAAPVQPATTFSQAPAQTAGAGGLDIEAMLAKALATTAPAPV